LLRGRLNLQLMQDIMNERMERPVGHLTPGLSEVDYLVSGIVS
jgi:hypothetical protein